MGREKSAKCHLFASPGSLLHPTLNPKPDQQEPPRWAPCSLVSGWLWPRECTIYLFFIYLAIYSLGQLPVGHSHSVSLNHQTQDPSHTSFLVGESTAPSLPSDLGVAMYLTLWLDPGCCALLPCFYILSSLL